MRLCRVEVVLLAGVLAAGAGCGDGDKASGSDAGSSEDAGEPDGGIVCLSCQWPPDFTWADGGEIRLDNVLFPGGVQGSISTAHFVAEQDGNMPFPNVAGDGAAYCNRYLGEDGDETYPFGARTGHVGADAAFAVPGRIYADVGPELTLQATDGSDSFAWGKYTDYIVPVGGGLLHDISYNPEPGNGEGPYDDVELGLFGGPGPNTDGTQINVTLAGGTDYLPEPVTFAFETIGGNDYSGIQLAPRPNPASFPAYDENGDLLSAGETLTVAYDQDLAITWDSNEGYNDAGMPGADLLTVAAIFQVAPDFQISHLCMQDTPGSLVIPAEFVNTFPRNDDPDASEGQDGWIFVSHLHHRLRTLDNERRIDLVGITSTATDYEVSGDPDEL